MADEPTTLTNEPPVVEFLPEPEPLPTCRLVIDADGRFVAMHRGAITAEGFDFIEVLESEAPELTSNHFYRSSAWVLDAPSQPSELEFAKTRKWGLVKRDRAKTESGGFVWNGHRFDSDSESVQRISGAVQLAMIAAANGQPFSVDWTLQDNSILTLSGADMIQVGLALGAHVISAHTSARALRDQIAAAASVAELAAPP